LRHALSWPAPHRRLDRPVPRCSYRQPASSLPPVLGLVHFFKRHDACRLRALVGHLPQVLNVITDRLNLDSPLGRDTEPNLTALLKSQTFPQLFRQRDLPFRGHSSLYSHSRIGNCRSHPAPSLRYMHFLLTDAAICRRASSATDWTKRPIASVIGLLVLCRYNRTRRRRTAS
jgi:hypothetical protein